MKKTFLIPIVLLLGLGVLGDRVVDLGLRERERRKAEEARSAAWAAMVRTIRDQIGCFKGEAGIVVVDPGSGREFSHQGSRLFPSASLVKVPLMAACFLAADEGKIALDRFVSLKAEHKLFGSGILKDMPVGTVFSVERLIGLMIYDSDNTAAHILTNLIGIEPLNEAFHSFGLRSTNLSRRIADYRSRDKGVENYTTAEDMALLLRSMHQGTLGNGSISDRCIRIMKLTRTNDRIPKYLPARSVIAHKTGLERGVCHDAGIVFTSRGDLIVVVLTQHADPGSSVAKEFIAKVAWAANRYLEKAVCL